MPVLRERCQQLGKSTSALTGGVAVQQPLKSDAEFTAYEPGQGESIASGRGPGLGKVVHSRMVGNGILPQQLPENPILGRGKQLLPTAVFGGVDKVTPEHVFERVVD